MKLQRKLTNREWEEIVALGPGVHNFRGKRTLIYNGEKLVDTDAGNCRLYNFTERDSWEVIIVLPGVKIIPDYTFGHCDNVKTVIMADSIQRIENEAFFRCENLIFVKLSRNLEYIGRGAFMGCYCLASIFIPSACREIGEKAFFLCKELIIIHVPQHTHLGEDLIAGTISIKTSPFETNEFGFYESNTDEVSQWIKNVNQDEMFPLHCECASYNPSEDAIYLMLKEQGLQSIVVENEIGITACRYLRENPFSEIVEQKLINRYVLDLMGEIM